MCRVGCRHRSRRGFAVVLVLSLLALALATAYAMMRTQSTTVKIQQNASRGGDARQAAEAGLSAALRKIHLDDWAGVDVPLTGQLSPHESFLVTFETGDAFLTENDPEYEEFPYRLTITSIGVAVDASDATIRAEHTVKAVVQLVRRARSAAPSNWQTLQQLTVFQWKQYDATIQFPVRVEGAVLVRHALRLCGDYPEDTDACRRYLSDLQSDVDSGGEDFRPVSGPVLMPFSVNSSAFDLLTNHLSVQVHDFAPNSYQSPVVHPGAVTNYQLYPGGKQYRVPLLQDLFGATLANRTIEADAVENPLGWFRSLGDLYLQDNVTIRGMVIGYGNQADLHIHGDNVHLEPTALQPLDGNSDVVQLPVALLADDLRIHEHCQNGSINGLTIAWDDFEFRKGDSDVSFDVRGKVFSGDLKLYGRTLWDVEGRGVATWADLLADFLAQLEDPLNPNPLSSFPQWLEAEYSFLVKPLLTIKPESSAVSYHWQDWSQPIYVPDANDLGLRWDIVSLDVNP